MQACNAFLPQSAQLHDSLSNGDGEIRTLDPLLARQVLSQLSYTPTDAVPSSVVSLVSYLFDGLSRWLPPMGLSGLEPPTSRLSGVRSNHLSYKPIRLMVVSTTRLFNSDDLSS